MRFDAPGDGSTFRTPLPISVRVQIGVGEVRLVAGERSDTTVTVGPTTPTCRDDVRAAARVQVHGGGQRLLVHGPRLRGLSGRLGSVVVVIALPAGSQVDADVRLGRLSLSGHLGECRVRTQSGGVSVASVLRLDVRVATGDVQVEDVAADASVTTGNGRVLLGTVHGDARVTNARGATHLGEVGGNVTVRATAGDVVLGRVGGDASVTVGRGDVRVAVLCRGIAWLHTGRGDVEAGIALGTAARVDASTGAGLLRTDRSPDDAAPLARLELRARTDAGDIVVRRALS